MKNDLDSMLEDFLMKNHIEDNGFSQKVVEQLPQVSSWVWVRDMVPALVFSVLCLGVWNYHRVLIQSFFMYRADFYQWLSANVASSVTISYTTLAAVGITVAYFTFEKIMHEIEMF